MGQVSDLPYQAGWELLGVLTSLFSAPLERQGLLRPKFLAGLQIEGVAPNFFDDVFLQNLALESAQGAFQGFITMYLDFSQFFIHLLRRYPNDSGRRALFRRLVELAEQLGKINFPD